MKMTDFEKRLVNAGRHSRRVAATAVRRLNVVPTRPGQRLLEVGCGNGAAALHVARTLRLAVTGVDVDPDQIALARAAAGSQPGVQFQLADATRLPFDDGAFDIVSTNKTAPYRCVGASDSGVRAGLDTWGLPRRHGPRRSAMGHRHRRSRGTTIPAGHGRCVTSSRAGPGS